MGPVSVRAAAVALLVALAATGEVPAARAHDAPILRPAEVWERGSALRQFGPRALNFVFRDARHTCIGVGARCLRELGESEFELVTAYDGQMPRGR